MKKKLVRLFLIIAIVLILLIIGYFITKSFITFGVKKLGEGDEIIIDYTNKEENIQNYEETNVVESIKKYEDSNGKVVYIPKNFKISDKQSEQTVDTGLVVIRARWK